MKKFTQDQWRWTLFSGIILLPGALVRIFDNQTELRSVLTLVLFAAIPIFLIWLIFFTSKNDTLLDPRSFEKKYGETSLKILHTTFKLFGIGLLVFILWVGTIPIYLAFYRYLFLNELLIIKKGAVERLQTGLFDPFGFVYQNIYLKEEPDHGYSLWYPSTRMHFDENVRLKVLPGTNIVLDSEKIK